MKKKRRILPHTALLYHSNKKIIIWGIKKTGESLIRFLQQRGHTIIMVDRTCNEYMKQRMAEGIRYATEEELPALLDQVDTIIPSPGITLPPFIQHSPKLITELDLFFMYWKKPIIAITGSVGKTSTTSLIHTIISQHLPAFLGGNIGIPLMNANPEKQDMAIIEVSNAQLRYTTLFAPDYFVWTNTHQNHLDMHGGNMREYVAAKAKPFIATFRSRINAVFMDEETKKILEAYKIPHPQHSIILVKKKKNEQYPAHSFPQNWRYAEALCRTLRIPFSPKKINWTPPEHRIEFCGIKKGILFFNDSKSTIIAATIAAETLLKIQYPDRAITIIIGGLAKGVNRIVPITALAKKNTIVFFGPSVEYHELVASTNNEQILCAHTLEEAIEKAITRTKPNDIILFSPGGASFDFFTSYEERGEMFKKAIAEKFYENS